MNLRILRYEIDFYNGFENELQERIEGGQKIVRTVDKR